RDETGLADSRRAGDSDRVRRAGLRIEVGDDPVREWVTVLHERDRARDGAPVAVADAGRQILPSPVAAPGHARTLIKALVGGCHPGGLSPLLGLGGGLASEVACEEQAGRGGDDQ